MQSTENFPERVGNIGDWLQMFISDQMNVFAKVSLPGGVMPDNKRKTDFLKDKTLLKTFVIYQRPSVADIKPAMKI